VGQSKSLRDKVETQLASSFEDGSIQLLTLERLEEILLPCELYLIAQLYHIDPEAYGISFPRLDACYDVPTASQFARLPDTIQSPDFPGRGTLPVYVPTHLLNPLSQMLDAMEASTTRRYYVESGYRSSYYQAYLFLEYLEKNKTMDQTVKFVALPCRSEHGSYDRPAIDFITNKGISDQAPIAFSDRSEFNWMISNSRTYGFYLSFPGNNRYGYNFEPWHWHWEPEPEKVSEIPTPLGMQRVEAMDEWGMFIENLPLKPQGTKTMLRYRKEHLPDGQEFINHYTNYVYEDLLRTLAVIDIPVVSISSD